MDKIVSQVTGNQPQSKSQPGSVNDREMVAALIARLKIQGIKSITYRFPVEEILEFDQMILDIQKGLGGKRVSKNDVMRSATNFFLEDWQKRGKNSIVFKMLSGWVQK